MEQRDYLAAVFSQVDENNEATCFECGSKCKIIHAIVDHDLNAVKILCHGCYVTNYVGQKSDKGK